MKEEYDITPIFSASHHGQPECLRLLIEHANRTGNVQLDSIPFGIQWTLVKP